MAFWELIGIVVSFGGVFALILGAFLAYAARKDGEATRELIRNMEERMTRHFTEVPERMDMRADERHREVIEVIRALKAA